MASARPAILVTGASGQVGYELVRALAPLGRVVAPGRDELDLSNAASLRSMVERLRPTAVVNAAAYTAVDRAESEPELCRRVNAGAPGALAAAAAAVDAVMVQYSTDYVFDGSSPRPYVESDPPCPVNVYGASKLEGELAVAAAGGTHLILRTSWVYGARGANFLRTMTRLAREREEIRVVDDQVGAPTWSRAIAESTAALLSWMSATADASERRAASGIYHLTSAGATSWYDFARAIVSSMPARDGGRIARVTPIPSSEYPTPARRPARSVLDCSRLATRFGISIPDWREQLDLVLMDVQV